MAVNLLAPENLLPVSGARLSSVQGELRYTGRDDLLLIELDEGTTSAAVFTQNKFSAAAVDIAKHHLGLAKPRALLINAGNANAGTGKLGLENCLKCCSEVAEKLGLDTKEVLPFSTGVIGEQFDMAAMSAAIAKAASHSGSSEWIEAANAIMTTDTVPKAYSTTVEIGGERLTITGISKGSGMICPDMATMLAFVTTDAPIEYTALTEMLQRGTAESFNRITVDSDTSTNDALVISATGKANIDTIADASSKAGRAFYDGLREVLIHLATSIIRDGEGASKFVTIDVINGLTSDDCKAVAYSVAHSPLVKTALFAGDPNWGRLLMAIGKAPAKNMDVSKIGITINNLPLIEEGQPDKDYSEDKGKAEFLQDEIFINIDLALGTESYKVWTSDLSHEYVTINSDYRS